MFVTSLAMTGTWKLFPLDKALIRFLRHKKKIKSRQINSLKLLSFYLISKGLYDRMVLRDYSVVSHRILFNNFPASISIKMSYLFEDDPHLPQLAAHLIFNPLHGNDLFLYSLKIQKTRSFLTLSEVKKRDQWHEMG